MDRYADPLRWLDSQASALEDRVRRWTAVNSWSRNREGLRTLEELLRGEFADLGAEATSVELPAAEIVGPSGQPEEVPLGAALSFRSREQAPTRVLLVGHLDTVFPPDHGFRATTRDGEFLRGPGVADAKGGVAVLLGALEALERSPWAEGLGWEALLTPDEELGSPGSAPLLRAAAGGCRLGLVFEPGLPMGGLVGGRRGSGTYTAVARGRGAHSGRNPAEGRNAIHALADFVVGLKTLDGTGEGIGLNVGQIQGGWAANAVPELATCRFSARVASPSDRDLFLEHLRRVAGEIDRREGFSLTLHGGLSRPPWPLDESSRRLLEALVSCGRRLGDDLGAGPGWEASGGASDANHLADAGLPVADGLGPPGEGLHTPDERIRASGLVGRARLVALFLMMLGAGEIAVAEG